MATNSSAIQKKIETLKKGLNNKFITAAQKEKIKAQVQKLESQSKASAPKKTTKPAASSSLTRLQKLVKNKKYSVYKGKGVDLKKDSDRPAKAIGKRISKSGKTYYEYRANRIDVKQPSKKAPYPKLEKGGYMAKGGKIKVKVGDKVKTKTSLSEAEVYEVSMDGYEFKLKDRYGNKSNKIYYTSDFSNSEIKPMAKGGYMADGGYVAVSETKDGYWVVISRPTTKESAEEMADSLREDNRKVLNEETKVVTLEEAKAHKKIIGKEYLEKGGYMAKGGVTEKEVVESNADMVLSQIKAVKHHAEELSSVVSRKSNIEAWVVGKIERASTDLSDITHYLEGNKDKMSMGGTVRYYAHKMDKK